MFDKFPELHTERLELVEITQSHLSDFYEIFRDERAAKYYNIIPFKKEEEAQKYIDWFQSRYKDGVGIRWGIRLKDKSSIIGTAGFNNYQKDHRANLGYDLHVDYWNKGYITEALSKILNFGFNTLGINRIEAEVMQGNIASEKVLEKLGFTKEGILRDWMYWNNNHYDMTMFSLLKEELIPQIEKGKSDKPLGMKNLPWERS
jgi:ribosomal-protein-alanine N-acetyltransferase